MAFFDTLRNMGLFQPPASTAPSQQDTPYGLSEQDIAGARNGALGQMGMQLLAAGMAMPSAQRAQILAQMNPAGAMQTNILNTAQMRLAQKRLSREDEQYAQEQAAQQRKDQSLKAITDQIKQTPPGQVRDAAMYFLQIGDLEKAGEIIFGRKQQFDPATGGMVTTDFFGSPIGQQANQMAPKPAAELPATANQMRPQGIPQPVSTGVPGAPQPSSVAELTDGWERITGDRNLPPQFGGQVDQATMNWRSITGDQNLTPDETRYIMSKASAAGNAAAGFDAWRDLRKAQAEQRKAMVDQRNAAGDDQRQSLQDNRGAAKDLRAELETATKPYQTVVMAAERATQIATDPNMSPSDKIAVLYDYIKTLDPVGAVRDSDVQLAQSTQSAIGQLTQYFTAISNGGTISNDAVLGIARTMARLGDDAKARAERKAIELRGIAQARQVPVDMVFGQPQRGPVGPPMPMQMMPGLQPPPQAAKANPYTPQVQDDLMKYGG